MFSDLVALKEAARGCQACRLHETRGCVVLPEGGDRVPVKALFIGEGPGAEEDASGRPFCGRAGALLREQLRRLGFNRDNSSISNTVLCRPPENRDPKPDEMAACQIHLDETVRLLNPYIICALGKIAALATAGYRGSITKDAGKTVWSDRYQRPVCVMPHPSFYLRTKTSGLNEVMNRIRDAILVDAPHLYKEHENATAQNQT